MRFLSCAIVFAALGCCPGVADARAFFSAIRRKHVEVAQADAACRCACCITAERRPSQEFGHGGSRVCVANRGVDAVPTGTSVSSAACRVAEGEQCTVEDGPSTILEQSVGSAVDYERFCMYSCQQRDPGESAEVGISCMDIPPEVAQQLDTPGGNAIDPAKALAPAQAAQEFGAAAPSASAGAKSGSASDSVGDENDGASGGAPSDIKSGEPLSAKEKRHVKAAVHQAISGSVEAGASAAAVRAERSAAEATSVAVKLEDAVKMNAETVADLGRLEREAAGYRQVARKAREETQEIFAQMQQIAEKAAQKAAAKAKTEIEQELKTAESQALIVKLRFGGPAAAPGAAAGGGGLPEAAGAARAPYDAALGRAMTSRTLYAAQARQQSAEAASKQAAAKAALEAALKHRAGGFSTAGQL